MKERTIFLVSTIALLTLLPSQSRGDIVEKKDVSLVQLTPSQRMIACYKRLPGSIQISRKRINFVGFSQYAAQLKRNKGSSREISRYLALAKSGKSACAGRSGSKPTSLSALSSLAFPAFNTLTTINSITSPLVTWSSANTPLAGVFARSTTDSLLADFEGVFPCAEASLDGMNAVINFPAGCSAFGLSVEGTLRVSISITTSSVGGTVILDQLKINGKTLSGEVEVSLPFTITAKGIKFSNISLGIDATVEISPEEIDKIKFTGTIQGGTGAITVNGSGSYDDSESLISFVVTDLHKTFGTETSCYPDGGKVKLDFSGAPDVTITFSLSTPVTGEVSVQIAGLPAVSETLPACTR